MCIQKNPKNWPYNPLNTTFFVPPNSVSSSKIDINSGCDTSMIACIRTSPISNTTTTDKVDTDVNNDLD